MNTIPRIPIEYMRCSGPISPQDNSSRHVPQTSESTLKDPSNLVKTMFSTLNNDRSPSLPLLKLPLELRENVYRHVLSRDKQALHLTRGSELDEPTGEHTANLSNKSPSVFRSSSLSPLWQCIPDPRHSR